MFLLPDRGFTLDAVTWGEYLDRIAREVRDDPLAEATVVDIVPDVRYDGPVTQERIVETTGDIVRLAEFNPHHDTAGRFAAKAIGGVTGPDLGAGDPLNLDADGKPWLDASGEHNTGWGPRGQLDELGQEVLSAKGLGGQWYRYSVPRGYSDVANPGHNGKGFTKEGHGIAYTKPVKGEQHFEARFAEHNFSAPTHTVKLTTEQVGRGGGLHRVTDSSTGRNLGTVSDQGKGKWVKHTEGTEYGGGGMLGMRFDSKPLAVFALAQEAVRVNLVEANPYHDERGRFASKGARGVTLDSGTIAGQVAKGVDDGGVSVSITGNHPDSGIMVAFDAKDGHSRVLSAKTKAERDAAIKDWVKEQRKFVSSNGETYFGGWVEGGKVYLDVSQRFPKGQRAAAIKAGQERNQIAVFDLDTFTDIPTGGTGK